MRVFIDHSIDAVRFLLKSIDFTGKKKDAEKVAKKHPRGSKKEAFWRLFDHFCHSKRGPESKGLKRAKH